MRKYEHARWQRTAANGEKELIAHSRDQDLHMRAFVTRPSDTAPPSIHAETGTYTATYPELRRLRDGLARGCASVLRTPSGGVCIYEEGKTREGRETKRWMRWTLR